MKNSIETKPSGLKPSAQFFYDQAGWSYDPAKETASQGRKRCARDLAKAEEKASNAGFSYQWNLDGQTNREWTNQGPVYETWQCTCRNAEGKVVGSLCGIDFGNGGEPWGNPYRRVVEAELASEAI